MSKLRAIWLVACLLGSLGAWAAANIGQLAPAFSLQDQSGKQTTSEQFRGQWLVLYFYPKADTPGCTQQACSFKEDVVLLRALGAQIVGVSTDDVETIRAFGQKHELPFTLLADPDGKIAEKYGSLLNLGLMKFAKRHTFLIDPSGKLIKRYTDLDTKTYAKTIAQDLRALSHKE